MFYKGYDFSALPESLKDAPRDFFQYDVSIASLAAAANSVVTLPFEASSTFIWMQGVVTADIAGAVQTADTEVLPLLTVLIKDTGASRDMMNQAVPAKTLFGQWGEPYSLPIPRVVMSNSTFQFTVANYSAATTYANIHLTLLGVKIFAPSVR